MRGLSDLPGLGAAHVAAPPVAPGRDPLRGMPLRDIIEWDVPNWSRALEVWWPAVRAFDPARARVLTVGERNGGLSLWFALLGFRVLCTDYGGPTAAARALHARHGVGHRVAYADADVFALAHADRTFDVVACKSVIGGLKRTHLDATTRTVANQAAAVAELRRVVAPGGYVLAAENLRATRVHGVLRTLAHRGRIGWRHPTPAELESMFTGFDEVRLHCHGLIGTRGRDTRATRLAARLDRLLSPYVPRSWRYIGVVVARV